MKTFLLVAACLSVLGGCTSRQSTDPVSPQSPATWIRTDAAVYRSKDTVHVAVTNVGSVSLIHGGPCGAFLEEWTGDRWAESSYQPIASLACASAEYTLAPGATYIASLPLGMISGGLFRFRLDDLTRSVEPALANEQRLTNTFRVQ